MSKFINPWGFKRPEAKRETKTFTDPAQPDLSLELTFEAMVDAPRRLQAGQLGDELVAEYVGSDGQPPTLQFAPPDGQALDINEALARNIAAFMTMQVDTGEGTYSFADWLGWAVVAPNAFMGVVAWAGELQLGVKGQAKDADPLPAPTGASLPA